MTSTPSMIRYSLIILIAIFFASALITPVSNAGEFKLSNPGIELRRIQICEECGEPLVVTSIAPGAAVRCPKCHRVQRRLPDSELKIKVYQICPSCSQRLDVSGLKPNEAFRCGACGFEQRVLPEAVYNPPSNAGTGKIPAEKTIKPAAKILPPVKREIPDAVVPGLNAPEPEVKREFDIEIETSDTDSDTTEKKPAENKPKKPRTENNNTPAATGAYLNLPEMDNDLEGRVSILVNGEKIYESEIMRDLLLKFKKYQAKSNNTLSVKEKAALYSDFRKKTENELITEKLVLQEALKRGYITKKSAISSDNPQMLFSNCKEQLAPEYAQAVTRPTTGELQKYYNSHLREFSYPDQYILDSIVIYNDRISRNDGRSSKIISDEIKSHLDKGVDFTLLASRYSEGAFHNDGGRIRRVNNQFIPADFLIKPLRTKNTSLQSGSMFGPIELPSCILFVQIAEVKKGNVKPFKTVEREVEKTLTRTSMDQAFSNWLDTVRKAAVIEYKK